MGIAEYDKLNAIELMKDGLELHVKDKVINDIVSKHVLEFEKSIRQEIESLVNSISFESIMTIKDNMNLRDELRLSIRWNENKPIHNN